MTVISVQKTPSCAAATAARPRSRTKQIGGSARGYRAIFVPSTALASPGYDGQPAVYLYIAALEVNVLNAADRVFLDCRGALASPSVVHAARGPSPWRWS